MAPTLKEIKALSLEELIAKHDEVAQSTQVGLLYYRDEILRREQEKANQEMLHLTRDMHRMTVVMTRATLVALGIAIFSLVVSLVAVMI